MSRQHLTESGALGTIEEARQDGSMLVQIITPGWGSSGYYSPQVLEAAGKTKVWPAGTHMYFDHPSVTENNDRPERSVKDLAAVLLEDASWNGSALVARVKPTGLGKTVLADETFRKAIGVSVRASAEMEVGEAEKRSGWIVQEIFPDPMNSVDFVTHAGRGGKILEVLESARAAQTDDTTEQTDAPRTVELTCEAALNAIREARNVGQWMESRIHLGFTQIADELFGDGRLTREERIALSAGIGAALDSFVTSVQDAAPQLYGRDLWAEPEALAAVAEATTPNVPVHPAGQPNTTEEHTMPQIEEALLRELEEAHGRVPTLESERDTLQTALTQAQHDLAVERASAYAREYGTTRVREANSELAGPIVERIVAAAMQEIPLGEDQRLDTVAFNTRVDEARRAEETYLASIAENVGMVRGLGESQTTKTVEPKVVAETVAGVFGVGGTTPRRA
jgi:hypothetical protein